MGCGPSRVSLILVLVVSAPHQESASTPQQLLDFLSYTFDHVHHVFLEWLND